MKNKINRREVEITLKSLSKFPNRPLNKYGKLDVGAYNELSEVKATIQTLKDLGVKNNKVLGDLGFVAAAMVLHF